MTDRRFEYDPDLLIRCATSSVARFVVPNSDEAAAHSSQQQQQNDNDDDESCVKLFTLHANHYYGGGGGRHDALLVRRRRQEILNDEPTYILSSRMEAFIRNVVFVHNHNNNNNHDHHKVTLNRFTDRNPNQVILATSNDDDQDHFWSDEQQQQQQQQSRRWLRGNEDITTTTMLSTSQQILQVAANLTIGKGSMHHLHKHVPIKSKKRSKIFDISQEQPSTTIKLPTSNGGHHYFQTPEIDTDMEGGLLSIKRNKDATTYNMDDAVADDDIGAVLEKREEHEFDRYLNWATNDNPDGVSVVHDAFDQGTCGSCWALSATGSLEASAARHEAYKAYNSYLRRRRMVADSVADVVNHGPSSSKEVAAIQYAQSVEREAFRMLNLSIQELLDCDTAADQGCTGGNPLLAFFFIHRYGLVSWEQYPYVGHQDKCKTEYIQHPIATVKSWGIISANHENHMELALRYIGPVAVGINGADPEFLAYDGGIFDKRQCKQGANHALLIVGYGEEEKLNRDGTSGTTRYWIARNSWGTGWGESGMIRIRRGDGKKGTPGVCGVARSPSVALGGILLQHVKSPSDALHGLRGGDGDVVGVYDNSTTTIINYDAAEQWNDYSLIQRTCVRFHMSPDGGCVRFGNWVDNHWAQSLGLLGIVVALLAVWPLTMECRGRRRRRRLREMKRQKEEQRKKEGGSGDERTPLVSSSGDVSYGANERL